MTSDYPVLQITNILTYKGLWGLYIVKDSISQVKTLISYYRARDLC
jgi:hypothetical protein